MKKLLLWGVVLVAVAAAAGLVYIYAGWFNVAATEPHTPVGRWLFSTTMKQSVAHHAQGIEAPSLEVTESEGYRHYSRHCETCHGAPGVDPNPLAEGLRPPPPNLAETAPHWESEELYWIISNGIRMTGMPAWGGTYTDEELWQVVAFVEKLPQMSAQHYEELGRQAEESTARANRGSARSVSESVVVTLTDSLKFKPASITIRTGQTVRWENRSGVIHTVTAVPALVADPEHVTLPPGAGAFDSGELNPGTTFEHTFTVPGRYRYFCIPHEAAGMVAEIVVRK